LLVRGALRPKLGDVAVSARSESALLITLVSASAGSGKTTHLTTEVTSALRTDTELESLVAVTYTRKAAAELTARIRHSLIKEGEHEAAQRLPLAYVGTVHSVCLRLLQEFAIEAGLPPDISVVPGAEARLLREALESALQPNLRLRIEELAAKFQIRWDAKIQRVDWITPVQDIMTLARSNRIPPEALEQMGQRSADDLLSLLEESTTTEEELDRDCQNALACATKALADVDDGQANTKLVRETIDEILRSAQKGALRWVDWVRLTNLAPGKAAKYAVAPLQLAASRVSQHPRLRAELLEYTLAIYAAAASGLVAYNQWKKRRRLVDFVDLVDGALTLLEDPTIASEIQARLSLLVVDEFQDTSPVQLALFVQLHSLAGRSIWVGDRKQCIFEFAGADPLLMEALITWVNESGGDTLHLPVNWRARPELVTICSKLFAGAFARHGYSAEEVVVTAKRSTPERLARLAPLGVWLLETKSQAGDAIAIAEGIRRLLADPAQTPVVDRATDDVRDVIPGDIAILVATNAEAERLATALWRRGVRANVARAGLLATPEGTLVTAALRALLDKRDSLSRAVIDALTGYDGKEPEAWLTDRLRDEQIRHDGNGWDAPSCDTRSAAVKVVEALVPDLEGASPAEALDSVLAALDMIAIASRWPDPAQRVANLDSLRAMATDYEERCGYEREAATIAGLLRYFDEAAQEVLVREEMRASDEQHAASDGGAVTVFTYHRAKGLEWPIVVLTSLGRAERRHAFDVWPETDRLSFDPANPLGDRWIRYWPWPFGQSTKTPLRQRAEASEVGRAVADREERERVRLLYVGFTRARDHLVLAARLGKKGVSTDWLDELRHASGEKLLELPGDESEEGTVFLGEAGNRVRLAARVWKLSSGDEPPLRLDTDSRTLVFARPDAPKRTLQPYWVQPSRAAADWPETAKPCEVIECRSIGERLALGDTHGVDWSIVGNAIHDFLLADAHDLTESNRRARAERILAASDLLSVLGPDSLLRAGNQLRKWVESCWPGATWYREMPVTASIATSAGERRLSGRMDLLLVTTNGAVIIDHKSHPGGEATWEEKAREHAPQLNAYTHALEASGLNVVSKWLHFPVSAGVARLV
jgi:ATP-dependent helicase/nuclease subunit A